MPRCRLAPRQERYADDLRAAGIAVSPIALCRRFSPRRVPKSRSTRSCAQPRSFARIARRCRPDVVHVTLPWPTFGYPILLTSALLGRPTLVTFQLVPDALFVPRRRRLVYRWMRSRGQHWIAVSNHGRRLLAALYRVDPATIRVVHNGAPSAPEDVHCERREERSSVRTELGYSSDVSIVLSVGRLHAQKGQADLCTAMAGVIAARPDVRLVDRWRRSRAEATKASWSTALGSRRWCGCSAIARTWGAS